MSAEANDITQPFSIHLASLYQSLTRLIDKYQRQSISQSLIQETLAFSEEFIDVSKHFPEALLAQLQFYKVQYSYSVNLVFNQVLATYVIASRNQWNDTAIQHLLCCVISQFGGVIESLDRRAKDPSINIDRKHITQHNLPLLRILNQLHLEIWFSGVRHAELRYHAHPELILSRINKQSHELSILCLGTYIGQRLTRTKSEKALAFPQILRLIARKLSSADYSLLDGLLQYPTLVPPGSLVSLKDGRYLLVLTTFKNHLFGKAFSAETRDCANEVESHSTSDIKQVLSQQPIKTLSSFDTWWDESSLQHCGYQNQIDSDDSSNTEIERPQLRPKLFKLDTPPPTLLSIQAHLYSDDLDTNTLTNLILAEPVFAMHIKTTATLSSRENIVITDVKHGLLMHGFERANSILMDHALTLRLNQHYFPAQEQLLQFCHLFKHLVATISESKKPLTPELMACWAGFASAGFFTSPSLKSKLSVTVNQQGGPSLSHVIETENAHLLSQHAQKLCQCWDQPKQLLLALRTLESGNLNLNSPKQHDTIAYILGLGLILAKATYWAADYTFTEPDKDWLKLAPRFLGKALDYQETIEKALAKAHSYSPLTSKKR
ncbi:hypothetical protein [Alteromonas sp. a30]|uniref:hypothetical protein n=1 Tax=Alteromonas sp. a30 TaxID=2730917 RepID=UPI00228158AD|nr:hypothetical protein [Alteromonas sp. a30]MCY7294340.1 hypothetical protein [Alteromonas sp. a30]